MRPSKYIPFFFLLLFGFSYTTVLSQSHRGASVKVKRQKVDSLNKCYSIAANDTDKCHLLSLMVSYEIDDRLSEKYNLEIKSICEKNIAQLKKGASEYRSYSKWLAHSFINLGRQAQLRGDINKAITFDEASLRIREEIGDKLGVAYCLNNLGYTFKKQNEHEKALECYQKSLKILEELNDKVGIAYCLNNIGSVYKYKGDDEKALEYNLKSFKILEEIGDMEAVARSLNNLSIMYKDKGEYEKAFECLNRCIKIQKDVGDKDGICFSLYTMADVYFRKKDYTNALKNALESMEKSKEIKFPLNIRDAALVLYKIYHATGKHGPALANYKLYIQMRDSMNNESTKKAAIRSNLKYEYQKQAAADSVAHAKESEIKNVELKRQSAEIKAKKNQQYALFGGLTLVCLFSIFMFNRFKVTQKQKLLIEHQKEVVEEQKNLVDEKQREILDSIHYAKRIQMAQVPSEKRVWDMIRKLKQN